MPLGAPATFVKIGNFRFDLAEQNAHSAVDTDYSPGGAAEFTKDDFSAGMLTADQGVYDAGTPQYTSAKGVDAAFAHQLILQPAATTVTNAGTAFPGDPIKQVDFTPTGASNTAFLITAGRNVYKYSAGTWIDARDLGAFTASDIIVHGATLGIAYTSGHQYTTDATNWTTDNTDADRFGVLNQNLWRAVRPNSIYSATAFGGTWSAAYTVADSTYNINSITGVEQLLMIGKEDGLYTVDAEGTIIPLTPELRPQANANFASLRAVVTFNNDFYFRTLNGVIKIAANDGLKYRVGLDQLASPDLPTVVVQAMCADDRYLYALCANTSNDLMILRRAFKGSWHVFWWDGTAGTKVGKHIDISAAPGFPALFFSYSDGATTYTTKYIRLSTYPNAVDDSNYTYSTESQNHLIRLGRWGSPDAPTLFDRCVIKSRNLSANVTVTPYYSVDGGAITQFGSSSATSSPLATITPAAPPAGHLYDFYLYLVTNTSTTTPVVTSVSFQGIKRPGRRRGHVFTITAKSHEPTARGGNLRQSPVSVYTNINALRDTNVYVTVTDENQQQFSGLVTQVQKVSDSTTKSDTEPGQTFKVTVVEAPTTVGALSFTYGQAVYT